MAAVCCLCIYSQIIVSYLAADLAPQLIVKKTIKIVKGHISYDRMLISLVGFESPWVDI